MFGLNCARVKGALVQSARRGLLAADVHEELNAHLASCDDCQSAFDRQRRLTAAADALAREARRYTAPVTLERTLLAEFEISYRLSRAGSAGAVPRARRFVYAAIGGAIAASLAIMTWIANRPAPKVALADKVPDAVIATPAPEVKLAPPANEPVARRHRRPAAKTAVPVEQLFIAIPYTLPLESYERVDVLHVDVPVAALIAVGYPTGMMDPAARAGADVLVGQDGRARAIRLTSISTLNQ